MKNLKKSSRRSFIGKTFAATSTLALSGLSFKPIKEVDLFDEGLYMIGPNEGYTPFIGTLVSMLENMSHQVNSTIKDLTLEELDYQLDEKSNTIGALILHIVSSEKFHQVGTL
jgi:hypothetical protein